MIRNSQKLVRWQDRHTSGLVSRSAPTTKLPSPCAASLSTTGLNQIAATQVNRFKALQWQRDLMDRIIKAEMILKMWALPVPWLRPQGTISPVHVQRMEEYVEKLVAAEQHRRRNV